MSVLNERMIDYGVTGNKVHLGIVPDTDDGTAVALTDTPQSLTGIKTFSSVATSPGSAATITDAMPVTELLTHDQLEAYAESKKEKIALPHYIVTETPLDELIGRPLRENEVIQLFDPDTGSSLGSLIGGGGGRATYNPPAVPPAKTPRINPLPDGDIVIPGGKIGALLPPGYYIY
jgi:hypothetical protein